MSRAAIQPLHVGATAPETMSVLQQRLLVAEEETEALIQDMGSLGVTREQVLDPPALVWDASQRPVSPVRVRRAMGGEGVLWRNCEELVSRVCRLESILHSLKLATFRLETERELNPSRSAQVAEQLSALQRESEEEQRAARKEVMQVQDQLWQACQERDEALEKARSLGEVLEDAAASKMEVALAAEELKVVKVQMAEKLLELKAQLSQEADCRLEMEQSHGPLLQRVEEMEGLVELERERVQALQTDCQALQRDRQEVRQVLREERERASQLEKHCQQLRDKADGKDSIISQQTDELNSALLALQRLQQENSRLQKNEVALKTAADSVQHLNAQLEGQCLELSVALRSMAVENARLLSQHQAELKVELQAHSAPPSAGAARACVRHTHGSTVITAASGPPGRTCCSGAGPAAGAARRNIQAELQGALKDRLRLQQELEAVRSDHEQLRQDSTVAQETAAAQRELLESTINRLRGELSGAGREGESMKREKDRILTEMQIVVSKLEEERSCLQTHLNKAKSEYKLSPSGEEAAQSWYTHGQAEYKQQVKKRSTLEKKYAQIGSELSSWKTRCHTLEQKLRQVEASLEVKEEGFAHAMMARDEALQDYQALRDQMEQHRSKVCQLEEVLGAQRQDGHWVAETLQGVLASNSRLKSGAETLRAELGGREEEVSVLKMERVQIQQDVESLQTQVDKLQRDLMMTDTEMEPLHKALETVSLDNKQLAQSLEQALLANNKLLSRQSRAQHQQDSMQSQQQHLLSQREAELRETREEVKWLTNHLESMKEQLKKERTCEKRASNKEITELKKALEETSSRSGDLSRANRELREKVAELEKVVSGQKARIKDLNTQMKQHLENRAALASSQRVKEMEETLKGLEGLKDEYQRRNDEQSKLVQQFQCELHRLSSNQEGELETEREHRQVLQDKCQRLEENVRQLRQSRDEAEERLREASLESQQVTENLVEAHSWFRSKFNSLTKELERTKPRKEPSEEDLRSLGSSKEGGLGTSVGCDNKARPGPTCMEPEWTATMQRWETKRELARIAGRYRHTGQTDRPTHRQTDT
ncbi:hypothetical protein AAFF_G00186280 [Aldrovandia affinis]|uniref:Uncharacterized protein n=1 Tax=Aldrovandia affinis TaxID=143900 RepID=A0AAD7SXS9_9TELE|nr:hypothetical protein AAFF_G00186280 [Aldrovandia affinis]